MNFKVNDIVISKCNNIGIITEIYRREIFLNCVVNLNSEKMYRAVRTLYPNKPTKDQINKYFEIIKRDPSRYKQLKKHLARNEF